GAVGPEDARELDVLPEPIQSQLATVAVLKVGRSDDRGPHQAECVNDEMPFAADDFFSPHRNRGARLVRLSSRSACRGSQPRGSEFSPAACPLARAAWSAIVPRCRRVASDGNSEIRSDREAD